MSSWKLQPLDFEECEQAQDEQIARIHAWGIFDRLRSTKRSGEESEEDDIEDFPESESLRFVCMQVAKTQIGHSYKELYECIAFDEVMRMRALALGCG